MNVRVRERWAFALLHSHVRFRVRAAVAQSVSNSSFGCVTAVIDH